MPPTTHRTNSLGWAKSDCHTCQSLSRVCDRRRPRCYACTAEGIVCGGFALELQWQNPGQRTRSRGARKTSATGSGNRRASRKTTHYAFVRERETFQVELQAPCEPSEPIIPQEALAIATSLTPDNMDRTRRSAPDIGLVPVLYSRQPDYFRLSSSTLEQLSFFAWTFSPVTLTYDVKANPWQACIPQIEEAPFLLDAVRALVVRHRSHIEEKRESISVLELKDRALTSFAQSISTVSLEVGISVSLILIGIDYAESAYSNWIVHLQGVRKMIEAAGGIWVGDGSMNVRAQIAQLVWYDTIIALLSRGDPVFPREYIEYILS